MNAEFDAQILDLIGKLIDEIGGHPAIDVYCVAERAMALLPHHTIEELARAAAHVAISRCGTVAWERGGACASCA